jgi:hypothetical protein
MRIILISHLFLKIISGGKWWGWSFFPFIVFRSRQDRDTPYKMNHELIHHRQQLELFIVFFMLWYLIEYTVYRLKGRSHYRAYLSVSFEREAYAQQENLTYLKKRKWYSFIKYLGKKAEVI